MIVVVNSWAHKASRRFLRFHFDDYQPDDTPLRIEYWFVFVWCIKSEALTDVSAILCKTPTVFSTSGINQLGYIICIHTFAPWESKFNKVYKYRGPFNPKRCNIWRICPSPLYGVLLYVVYVIIIITYDINTVSFVRSLKHPFSAFFTLSILYTVAGPVFGICSILLKVYPLCLGLFSKVIGMLF